MALSRSAVRDRYAPNPYRDGVMIFKKILLLFCLPSFIFASVDQHFKKALGKSDIHKMKNIDFIYMINLDERPEKFEKSVQQLHPFGIYPYRFSAVNGWELSMD